MAAARMVMDRFPEDDRYAAERRWADTLGLKFDLSAVTPPPVPHPSPGAPGLPDGRNAEAPGNRTACAAARAPCSGSLRKAGTHAPYIYALGHTRLYAAVYRPGSWLSSSACRSVPDIMRAT